MASFTVEPEVIAQKAEQLLQHADEYEAISAQLHDSATSMGAAYESVDNKTYVDRIENCVVDLKKMAEKLRQVATTLKEQGKMYPDREAANRQVASRLPG